MKENLRRPFLFAVIVIVGSLLILFDVPLLLLIPLIIIVGFIVLLVLGALTITEIKSAFAALKFRNLKNIGILKRLDQMKFFEKPAPGSAPKPVVKPAGPATPKEPGKAAPSSRLRTLISSLGSRRPKPAKAVSPETDKKPGLVSHMRTLFSSIGSLGSVIRQRNKQGKKVDDINKLLDKTVSEKVHATPPAAPAQVAVPAKPATPAGSGGGLPGMNGDADPFLSLSGDEFDAGLLDGLGDDDMSGFSSPGDETGSPDIPADAPPPSQTMELPPPTLDLSSAAGDILKASDEGLEEFSGLESGETADTELGDLDSLSLDDLEGDLGDETLTSGDDGMMAAPETPPSAPAAAPPSPDDSNAVKTAWIPSDAPKGADQPEDQISTQADMAAFAGGASADDDMLSSLASDVKHVKKDKDVSLLRELKDFRAPAGEIEEELSGMYERMKSDKLTKRKTPPSAGKGTKER
jgi:hypothetical protein